MSNAAESGDVGKKCLATDARGGRAPSGSGVEAAPGELGE